MINFDDVTKENIKEQYPNWPQIPDHPYRMLIIGVCGSGKSPTQYLYAKDPYEEKYRFLINKQESTDLIILTI